MTPEERFTQIEENLRIATELIVRIDDRLDRVSARLDRAVRLGVQEVRAERGRRRKAMEEIDNKFTHLAAAQLITEEKMQELRDAQKATQESLKAFIDSLRRGGNGHV